MRIPVEQRRFGSRFNITPLIDVVFLLIIFFLVSSHFVRSESLEQVDLPTAEQTLEDKEAPRRRLVITVTADGTTLVSGQPISLDEISNRLATDGGDDPSSLEVRIRGDRGVEYFHVEPILLACARVASAMSGSPFSRTDGARNAYSLPTSARTRRQQFDDAHDRRCLPAVDLLRLRCRWTS